MTRSRRYVIGRKILKLLERGWIQGLLAKTKDGEWCDPKSEHAVGWCLVGAIHACVERDDERASIHRRLDQAIPSRSPVAFSMAWNDVLSRRKSDVLALVRRAILDEGSKKP